MGSMQAMDPTRYISIKNDILVYNLLFARKLYTFLLYLVHTKLASIFEFCHFSLKHKWSE